MFFPGTFDLCTEADLDLLYTMSDRKDLVFERQTKETTVAYIFEELYRSSGLELSREAWFNHFSSRKPEMIHTLIMSFVNPSTPRSKYDPPYILNLLVDLRYSTHWKAGPMTFKQYVTRFKKGMYAAMTINETTLPVARSDYPPLIGDSNLARRDTYEDTQMEKVLVLLSDIGTRLDKLETTVDEMMYNSMYIDGDVVISNI